MVAFSLDLRLEADTVLVCDLDLCAVRLMDDANYPWLVLVPRRAELVEIVDLDAGDRTALMEEIAAASGALKAAVRYDKLNVAALGNQVAQLHVHVIARRKDDAAWPRPVWGVAPRTEYDRQVRAALVTRLRERFTAPESV